nr:hypothetical protein [Tanacetum cinerariifolium]
MYPCEFCGSNAQNGHYCTPQAQFNNPEQGYSQDFNFPQYIYNFQQQYFCCGQCGDPYETFQCQQVNFYEPCCENCGGSHENFQCQPVNYCESNPYYGSYYPGFDQFGDSHPQQYLCCENCGGPHETFQCQPTNEDYFYEQNPYYNSNSFGFDHCQPPQSFVIHQPPQELSIQEMEDLKQQYLDELKRLSNVEYRDEIKIAELTENFNGMSIEIRKKEKLLQQEQWAYLSTHPSKRLTSFCYDDDDKDCDFEITPVLSTKEPINSLICQIFQKKQEEKRIEEEQAASARYWKIPACCDDDDDYDYAITPEETNNSLSMGDEHLYTIRAMESDKVIKSSVEDLVPIPSEFEGIPDTMCDVHFVNNSTPLEAKDHVEIVINSNDDISSSDDDSLYNENIEYVEASPHDSEVVSLEVAEIVTPEVEDIKDDNLCEKLLNVHLLIANIEALKDNPTQSSEFLTEFLTKNLPDPDELMSVLNSRIRENLPSTTIMSNEVVLEKIVLKPLFEEEIIPMKIDQHPDNVEFDLMESLRTHDSSLLILSKIDSLLDEFTSELTLLKSISPGIDETDCDFEGDIRLIEKLLYDNSSPRLLEEFVSVNSDAEIESFSPSPIPVKDSDSLRKEIDLRFTLDYPMPPGIKDDDYDSKRDIIILKDLPCNNTVSFAEKESFHFDIPSFSRTPTKPPNGNT